MKKLNLVLLGIVMLTQQPNKAGSPSMNPQQQIKVRYTNYRGETALRTIIPVKIFWGTTEHHPQEQWLLEVFDIEKDAVRIYAFKDIKEIL